MVSVKQNQGMSRVHFRSAKIHRDRMKEIESKLETTGSIENQKRLKNEHTASFIGCIFCCAGVIESYSREFADHAIEEVERMDDDRLRYQNIEDELLIKLDKYDSL